MKELGPLGGRVVTSGASRINVDHVLQCNTVLEMDHLRSRLLTRTVFIRIEALSRIEAPPTSGRK